MDKNLKRVVDKGQGTQGPLCWYFVKINLFIALLLFILIPVQAQAQRLTMTIQENENYDKRNSLQIICSIKNNTTTDLKILKWNTPWDGDTCKSYKLEKAQERVSYDGATSKYLAPTEKHYLTIPAGKSKKVMSRVSDFHNIESGTYNLSYDGVIADVRNVNDDLPTSWSMFKNESIKSNNIQVKVYNDLSNANTFISAIDEHIRKKFANTIKIYGNLRIAGIYNNKDIEDTIIAHNRLILALEQRLKEFESYDKNLKNDKNSKLSGSYPVFFGRPDSETPIRRNEATYKKVKKVILATYNALKNEKITYFFLPDVGYGTNLSVALTWKRTDKNRPIIIGLRSLYKKAPIVSIDSKMGILMHELTHATTPTEDFKIGVASNGDPILAYGMDNCKKLAKRKKTGGYYASLNADNYEYFLETTEIYNYTKIYRELYDKKIKEKPWSF